MIALTDAQQGDLRGAMLQYAIQFLGKFYKWGGDDPSGFDCSGFVIELIKAVGALPRRADYTADGLMNLMIGCKVNNPSLGCLVFYVNDNGRAYHVEFCATELLSIGASGGGSNTRTIQDAINQNAFIKVRPIKRGGAKMVFVDVIKYLVDKQNYL